jgi:hypothetical protein
MALARSPLRLILLRLVFQVILEVGQQRHALSPARSQTSSSAAAVDLALDGEDRADLVQRLTRDRGFGPDVLVEQGTVRISVCGRRVEH